MTTAEKAPAPPPPSDSQLTRARKLKEALRIAQSENKGLRRELLEAGKSPLAFRQNRQRSVDIVDQPLILISQIQRSGGTLLSQLLDGHPECLAHPYELKWGRPEKWNWPEVDLTADARSQFDALDENWIKEFAALGLYGKAEGL